MPRFTSNMPRFTQVSASCCDVSRAGGGCLPNKRHPFPLQCAAFPVTGCGGGHVLGNAEIRRLRPCARRVLAGGALCRAHLDGGAGRPRCADGRGGPALLPAGGGARSLRTRPHRRIATAGVPGVGHVRDAGRSRRVRLRGGNPRRSGAHRLLPVGRQVSFRLPVALARAGGGGAVLAYPGARHGAARRYRLRRAPPREVRPHRRGADSLGGHHRFGERAGALSLAARRAHGRLVAHRRRPGLRGVRHRPFRARAAQRQAGGLAAGAWSSSREEP